MILSQKVVGIAVVASLSSALISFAARGKYTLLELSREIAGSAFGFSLIIIAAWVYPQITSDWLVWSAIVFVTARLATPVLSIFLWRLERVDITADIGTLNITSKGRSEDETEKKNAN